MKITENDVEVVRDRLKPHITRNMSGLGRTFTAADLAEKINAVPDTVGEKALLVHYWGRMTLAIITDNAEAVAGWLTALAVATHTAGFLLQKAASRVKSTKGLKSGQPSGTRALKEKSERRMGQLKQGIDTYVTENPQALKRGATACRNALRARKLMHGYSDSYVLKQVKLKFAEHRRQQAENAEP